jgi:hypothetical protein
MAQHVKTCALDECQLCAQLTHASPYAAERIELAMEDEDALEWIKVATTHEETDYEKAEAILSYMSNNDITDSVKETMWFGTYKVLEPIEFTIAGRRISSCFIEYKHAGAKRRGLKRGFRYLARKSLPFNDFRVRTKHDRKSHRYCENADSPACARAEQSGYSYAIYEIVEDAPGSSKAESSAKQILRELIANDILRVRWIPLARVKCRHTDQVLRLEYTQCEYDQLSEATTTIIKV